MGKVVHRVINRSDDHAGWVIHCPGCKIGHFLDNRWKFNGDLDRPTFTPSILVKANMPGYNRCHSFVTDGDIRFLKDCGHDLKNTTVKLEAF